ncbi:hypothetical protein [Myxococcus sp. RHSTA-1-4]|uniref:hypothetical protein n=1 Tax=Myxococcus sp. RHSTA-1-4 TaxID=2874601 RepID=UPI001CBE2E8B|nr:hypothetical protein [Myxococcus sp. RHSTA-1-4]MBZ4416846.1 hypothetical protein [Myxococcus sp. RHSTA-1-4]
MKQTTIVELAPLLFTMVAEDSLRRRARKLAALRAAHAETGTLPESYTDAFAAFAVDEERSIQAKDVFGRWMDDPGVQPPHFQKHVDPFGQWNPFEHHVKEWFAEAGEEGGFDEWHEFGFSYSVCPEIALEAACGDEDVAAALQSGRIGLHEVPADLVGTDHAEQRLSWLRDRVAAVRAEEEARPNPYLRAVRMSELVKSPSHKTESGDA